MKGYTLIETLIVVLIAGILIGMTFNLGWDYINFLKFKQDRESFINLIDNTIVRTRATNYYDNAKYSYLDLYFHPDGLDVLQGTGDAATQACSSTGTLLASHNFEHAILTGGIGTAGETVRVVPYKISCSGNIGIGGFCPSGSTGLSLQIDSQVTDDSTCYKFDLEVCKFILVGC